MASHSKNGGLAVGDDEFFLCISYEAQFITKKIKFIFFAFFQSHFYEINEISDLEFFTHSHSHRLVLILFIILASSQKQDLNFFFILNGKIVGHGRQGSVEEFHFININRVTFFIFKIIQKTHQEAAIEREDQKVSR
jgi:hypothetical protein